MYFLRSSYIQPCGKNCPRTKGQGMVLLKKFFLPIESWFFTFFTFFFAHPSAWCYLQCDCYNVNVKFLIFFKKFYKVHRVGVLNQDPRQQETFNSLIITNMELRFEPCVLNLTWKWGTKDIKKREDHLIFISFGVKNIQKK